MSDLKPLFQGLQEKPESKRYAVTLDFYIWVESDESAIEQSEKIAQMHNATSDNQCSVVSVHDASETRSKPRKIK